MKISKNRLLSLLKVLFGLLVLSFLFLWVDLFKVWQILKETDIKIVIFLFLIFISDRLFMAFKWGLLLRANNSKIPFSNLAKAYFYAAFAGQFLPASIGGDIVRYYKVKNRSITNSQLFTSVALEKFFGMIAIFVVSILAFIYSVKYIHGIYNFNILFLIVGVILILLLIVLFLSIKTVVFEKVLAPYDNKLIKMFKKFLTSLKSYSKRINILLLFFVLCLIEQAFPIFSDYLYAHSLNISISLIAMAFIVSTTNFLSRIPISLSAIGIQEGILTGLFLLLGFSKEQGLALGLGTRVLEILFTLPIPIIYFSDLMKSVKFAKKESFMENEKS